ncbi:MAG: hypothetical protein V1898_00895 [Patescibacteria group bacterium]
MDRIFEFACGMSLAFIYCQKKYLFKHWSAKYLSLLLAGIIFYIYTVYTNSIMTAVLVLLSGPLIFIFCFQIGDKFLKLLKIAPFIIWLEKYAHAIFLFHLPFLSWYTKYHSHLYYFFICYFVGILILSVAGQKTADYINKSLHNLQKIISNWLQTVKGRV